MNTLFFALKLINAKVHTYKFLDVAQIQMSLKRLTQSSVSCALGKTCKESKTSTAYKQINICKCEEQSARESSTAPCDCSITPLDKTCQLTISGISCLESEVEDSDSDEFCECCSCGCENSSI